MTSPRTTSPRTTARVAGVFYLLNIITAIFGMFGTSRLVVAGDAPATAASILAHEGWFRLCFASNVVATACYLVVTVLLYELLMPAGRSASRLGVVFSLTGCAVGACATLGHLAVLTVLGDAPFLSALSIAQRQALAMLMLKLQGRMEDVGILFFGGYCILLGWLIYRSGFMPRVVGALVALSGVGWLTYLWPPLAFSLSSVLPVTGLLGEGGLTICLLMGAVNVERWRVCDLSWQSTRTT